MLMVNVTIPLETEVEEKKIDVLREVTMVLAKYKIVPTRTPTLEQDTAHLVFNIQENSDVLRDLLEVGVGVHIGSIQAVSLDFCRPLPEAPDYGSPSGDKKAGDDANRASLFVISKVIESTSNAAVVSFDFLTFLVVAAILAALGLVLDNAVIVVASMLVSPFMNGINALTIGAAVRNSSLFSQGTKNVIVSFLTCLFVGFCFGFLQAGLDVFDVWLTSEMESRCTPSALVYGAAIAIPSGVGVALSVLNQSIGGLVGVAISASLLPPVVNAGMIWGSLTRYNSMEFVIKGGYSIALTIINIICVFLAGIVMFRIKQISPEPNSFFFDLNATKRLTNDQKRELRQELDQVTAAGTVKKARRQLELRALQNQRRRQPEAYKILSPSLFYGTDGTRVFAPPPPPAPSVPDWVYDMDVRKSTRLSVCKVGDVDHLRVVISDEETATGTSSSRV